MQEPPGRATKARYRFTSTIHPINAPHLASTTALCQYAKLQLQSRMVFLAAKHQMAHTALLATATILADMLFLAHGVASRTAGCVRAYCRVTLGMMSCLADVLGPGLHQIFHSMRCVVPFHLSAFSNFSAAFLPLDSLLSCAEDFPWITFSTAPSSLLPFLPFSVTLWASPIESVTTHSLPTRSYVSRREQALPHLPTLHLEHAFTR